MNVSGHLLSTAEIESALAMHPAVVEAAVVAAEHQIKGHSPYAFVVLRKVSKFYGSSNSFDLGSQTYPIADFRAQTPCS
jgi:acyl-coenzyme A synthetase/AMP-(fatty) acid ligase